MAKLSSASSPQDGPLLPSENFIVRRTFDPDEAPPVKMLEHLKKLEDMPDESIRTDLIPELPREAWARAVKNPFAAALREQTRRKAS